MTAMCNSDDDRDFIRLPGLYRTWDLPCILEGQADYRIQAWEATGDGTPLFAVFVRRFDTPGDAPTGLVQ